MTYIHTCELKAFSIRVSNIDLEIKCWSLIRTHRRRCARTTYTYTRTNKEPVNEKLRQ